MNKFKKLFSVNNLAISLSFILVVSAQILFRKSNIIPASILLLLSIFIFAFSSKKYSILEQELIAGKDIKKNSAKFVCIRIALGVFALILFSFAIIYFSQRGESWFVVLSWILSLILLFFSLFSLKVFNIRFLLKDKYLIYAIVIAIISFVLSLTKITEIPVNLDGDFASHGLQARAIVQNAEKDIFRYGWAEIPVIGFLPTVLSMKIFGIGLLGLNFAGALEGALIIAGVYLLSKESFDRRVGLIACALTSVSYVFIHFSRSSEYIDPVLFMVYSVYFFILAVKNKQSWQFYLSGIFSGIGFNMYYSGRIIIFLILSFIFYLLLFKWRIVLKNWYKFILLFVGVLFAFGPYLVLHIKNTHNFNLRTKDVYIFSEGPLKHEMGVYKVNSKSGVFLNQLERTLLSFNYFSDTSTQFRLPKPYLDFVTGAFFALGFGYFVFRVKKFQYAVFILWIVLMLIFGCLTTINPPFWPRLVGIVVPVSIISAVFLDVLFFSILANGKNTLKYSILILLILGIGFFNWKTYLKYALNNTNLQSILGRYVAKNLPNTTKIYFLHNYKYYDTRIFDFLAPDKFGGFLTVEDVKNRKYNMSAGRVILIENQFIGYLSDLNKAFPKGNLLPITNNQGSIQFYLFFPNP